MSCVAHAFSANATVSRSRSYPVERTVDLAVDHTVDHTIDHRPTAPEATVAVEAPGQEEAKGTGQMDGRPPKPSGIVPRIPFDHPFDHPSRVFLPLLSLSVIFGLLIATR